MRAATQEAGASNEALQQQQPAADLQDSEQPQWWASSYNGGRAATPCASSGSAMGNRPSATRSNTSGPYGERRHVRPVGAASSAYPPRAMTSSELPASRASTRSLRRVVKAHEQRAHARRVAEHVQGFPLP
ncbi:hypothetical protein Dimus_007983, partial [Dionaea muscipula]